MLKTIAWSATQPNTGAAATAVGSDSLVIENDRGSRSPVIIDLWGHNQVLGFHQIIRPNSAMETTRDLKFRVAALNPLPVLGRGESVPVQAQETLAITVAGSNTAGDVEIGCATILYPGLGGGNFLSWSQLRKKGFNLQAIDFSIATSAAGYTTQAGSTWGSLLRANQDYAILGITTTVANASVAFLGPDSGNVGVGLPGVTSDPQWSAGYFGELSRMHGDLECIPTFNSGNLSNSFLRVLVNETTPTVAGTLWLKPLRG